MAAWLLPGLPYLESAAMGKRGSRIASLGAPNKAVPALALSPQFANITIGGNDKSGSAFDFGLVVLAAAYFGGMSGKQESLSTSPGTA